MKKYTALLIALMMLLCTACATKEAGSALPSDNKAQTSEQSAQESVPEDGPGESEAEYARLEQETYELLLSLNDPALNVFFWYFSDPTEDLQLETGSDYEEGDYYRKVGRFATIAEMKVVTEQYFTRTFCENVFFGFAFEREDGDPEYKEIDGQLYRNIGIGGIGWPFSFTEDYELAYADEQWRVLTVRLSLFDKDESWETFVFQNEDGAWKFHHFYYWSAWQKYEQMAGPLLSSSIAAYDWQEITDLDPDILISYYLYQFLSDVGDEYNDGNPYPVPAAEAVENLSLHFEGITKEMLIEAAQAEYSGMEYNEASDTFLFLITYDRGEPLVLGVGKSDGNVILQSLAIAKNGRAVRRAYLTARETDDGLFYLSNQVEQLPG